MIEEYGAKPEDVLRPAFDALWQAGGWSRCYRYDDEGKWIGAFKNGRASFRNASPVWIGRHETKVDELGLTLRRLDTRETQAIEMVKDGLRASIAAAAYERAL
jgi:hypothetical protein